ncbi:Probable protein phosphatase 2C 76 [Striga hermonthica]|uniref:protein-serine/threonine phosphatase n=1 Tax=Striga hermonthica TaxID=68872 RepID=A0A9N7RHB2_STRHE|nr:Probable protein phosphatase 2C 76 [Striga hermonthica]
MARATQPGVRFICSDIMEIEWLGQAFASTARSTGRVSCSARREDVFLLLGQPAILSMLCNSFLRSIYLWTGYTGRYTNVRYFSYISRDLNATRSLNSLWGCKLGQTRKMMVDSDASAEGSMFDILPEKHDYGGYASGGWKSKDGTLSCGYSSFRGKRASMEDFYDIKSSKVDGQSVCLFGIFDGHGGARAAEFLKEHLFENLLKHPEFIANTKLAISETYQQTDRDFLDSEKETFRDDGSTASTAVLVGNHLYVANVGDSRTIISKAGKAIPLSEDHKPNRSDERKRIESAGGVVMWAGTWRVGGVLAMSRAFGNRMLKQFVVAEPEIQDLEVDQNLELLVLASDGLWDVVPNEDAVSIAQTEDDPECGARKLTETAFTRGSADNITCIVVKFHHAKVGPVETRLNLEPNPEPDKTNENTNQNFNIPEEAHESLKVEPEEALQNLKADTGETVKG